MGLLELYQDYSVPFKSEGHKHCRPGWVQTRCPYCTGNPGWHLGYSLEDNYFRCWRCGWHPIIETLALLLQVERQKARSLWREYREAGTGHRGRKKNSVRIVRSKKLKLPHLTNKTGELKTPHIKYLKSRGFNPNRIVRKWKAMGTGPVSKLDGINYNHRILIPIFWDGKMVSFQTRDITGRSEVKYKACPNDREIVHHRDILYGDWKYCKRRDFAVVVEGVFDVWRVDEINEPVVATFGIEYSTKQLLLLSELRKVQILYDPERAAQKQAKKLQADLRLYGVDCSISTMSTDPAEASPSSVRHAIESVR